MYESLKESQEAFFFSRNTWQNKKHFSSPIYSIQSGKVIWEISLKFFASPYFESSMRYPS
jgi:DUF1365 family protein